MKLTIDSGKLYYGDRQLAREGCLTFASGDEVNRVAAKGELTNVALAPEPGGDIIWCARGQSFAVERKRFDDFVTSRHSGRLADELGRMAANYDWGGLVIEVPTLVPDADAHNPYCSPTDAYLPDSWQLALSDYQDMGIHVFWTRSLKHTVALCRRLATKYASREGTEPMRLLKAPRSHALRGLLWMQGIGPRAAEKLVAEHGSGRAVLEYYLADPEPISAIDRRVLDALDF